MAKSGRKTQRSIFHKKQICLFLCFGRLLFRKDFRCQCLDKNRRQFQFRKPSTIQSYLERRYCMAYRRREFYQKPCPRYLTRNNKSGLRIHRRCQHKYFSPTGNEVLATAIPVFRRRDIHAGDNSFGSKP